MTVMIPILPCRNVDEVVSFYESLGFVNTYSQMRPNPYVAVKLDDIELHFFGLAEFDPEKSFGLAAFESTMWTVCTNPSSIGSASKGGKVPSVGIPRLTRPRKKDQAVYGFSIVDPGGNWIRIAQTSSKKTSHPSSRSKLAQALEAVVTLAVRGGTPSF